MEFSLWKQLKKRLRRSRRPMWALGCFACILTLAAAPSHASANRQVKPEQPVRSVIEELAQSNHPVTVKLHRIYLCGDEMKHLGRIDGKAALRLLQHHPEWTAVAGKDGSVVMEQMIDDLSETCKQNAYFSLDKFGNLSLYDGPPKEKKVLRTFFQLDVHYMESSLPKERVDELVNGIRINDKDEYNSVLSTFSDYAVDKSEKVMKSTY
jgi:forespore regulator of the sigma-K checkpoint